MLFQIDLCPNLFVATVTCLGCRPMLILALWLAKIRAIRDSNDNDDLYLG